MHVYLELIDAANKLVIFSNKGELYPSSFPCYTFMDMLYVLSATAMIISSWYISIKNEEDLLALVKYFTQLSGVKSC